MTQVKFPDQPQHRELQALHEVARTLTSTLDLDQVLRAIMQQMAQFFRPETWSLMMIDEATRELFQAAGAGAIVELQHGKRIPIGEGIAGWVAQHGEPLIITNPEAEMKTAEQNTAKTKEPNPPLQKSSVTPITGPIADPIAGEAAPVPPGLRPADTVVCLPLRSRGRTYGVIQLVNCHIDAMRPQEIFFLHALCDYAAIAIQNSQAMEQIHKLTITDDCTGLYNARHMYEMLQAELDHCGKKFQPVSLIFFDLDHFKGVNDTHGHLLGSKLLAEVGTLVRNNIGPLCSAYRYGGDEFVVLLPNMGKESSLGTARLLLQTIQETKFLQTDGLKVTLGASFGVATCPEDGRGLHDIIRAADDAMYTIKNSTRNAVGGTKSGFAENGAAEHSPSRSNKVIPVSEFHSRH